MRQWHSAIMSGASLLILTHCVGVAHAQKPQDNAELKQIRDQDQAERQDYRKLTPQQIQVMQRHDAQHLERVRHLLAEGKVRTVQDYDSAGLVFQHGNSPEDYLTAHELILIKLIKSPNGSSNLIAASEDRFLESIGRRQRFGMQFGIAPNGKWETRLTQTDGDCVTDRLRADLLVPSIAEMEKGGPMASGSLEAMGSVIDRLKQRRDLGWITEQRKRPEAAELKQLATKPGAAARVLELYRADQLRTPEDYLYAAQSLIASARLENFNDARADRYLLAHELATVAASRGNRPAIPLAFETMDRFLIAVGLPSRYEIAGRKAMVSTIRPVSLSVKMAAGLK